MTTISVTAEHIAKGVAGDCELCPVALAILDAFPDLMYISVGLDNIIVGPRGARTVIDAPLEVRAFIEVFDGTGDGEPFTFTLDYPAVTK
jgi:hypothetical protein